MDAEAAKRSDQQGILLQEVLSGANKNGIVATPGSPVETALGYHGVPYVWGGESPSGLDCSGLILYVFNQHGVKLPHYSGYQFLRGDKIPVSQIQPNDVVFFGSPVHHVGMYIGGGYFIHAPKRNDFVKISKLADRSDIAGVRRYPWVPAHRADQGRQDQHGQRAQRGTLELSIVLSRQALTCLFVRPNPGATVQLGQESVRFQ